MATTTGAGEQARVAGDGAAPARRLGPGRPDALVVVCLLVLFGFPAVAVLSARGEPLPAPDPVPATPPGGRGGEVHAVPGFSAGSPLARTLGDRPPRPAELDPLMVRA